MKTTAWALLLLLISTHSFAQPEPESEKDPARERLGIRLGYVGTPSGLKDNFGAGFNLAGHFIQRIKKPVAVDISFGALFMGSTDNEEITREIFGTIFDKVTIRVVTVTVAPMLEIPLDARTNFYASGGIGLYTVSLLLDQDFSEFDLSNNHFGVNAGAGVLHRISTNWYIDLNAQIHHFWTADTVDRFDPDWFVVYSEGDSDPWFWAINAGVALNLF